MSESYFRLPTVRVKRDGGRGFRIINASDFDPARDVLADPNNAAPGDPVERTRKRKHLELKHGTHHR